MPEQLEEQQWWAISAEKRLALGNKTMELFRDGLLQDQLLIQLCQEIIAIESAWSVLSEQKQDGMAEQEESLEQEDEEDLPILSEEVVEVISPVIEENSELMENPVIKLSSEVESEALLQEATPPPQQQCVNCQAILRPGLKFCTSCGVPLVSKIEKVIAEPAIGVPQKFCDHCGASISAESVRCPICDFLQP